MPGPEGGGPRIEAGGTETLVEVEDVDGVVVVVEDEGVEEEGMLPNRSRR